MTAKKQIITWPIVAVILGVTATLSGTFLKVFPAQEAPKEKVDTSKIVSTVLSASHLKRVERNLENLKSETRQQYKYLREDFKYIKDELRFIRHQVRGLKVK